MTEEKIIKALECHACTGIETCELCPLLNMQDCAYKLSKYALDLINRQKAESESKNDLIHRQSDVISEQKEKLESIYSEAIKEFAERLKEKSEHFDLEKENFVSETDIDNLVKEMVGEG